MTGGGLLIGGLIVPVPGVYVANPMMPLDAAWARLNPADYHRRSTRWPRQVVEHTTKGLASQHIKPGAGPGGRDKSVAEFWHRDPLHSAAPIVIDNDGTAACLCDLLLTAPYHATTANDLSIGIETYQEADGGIYEAALGTMARVTRAACEALDIPFQVHTGAYHEGKIVERFRFEAPDVVGIYGHRDQAWKFPWQLSPEERTRYPNGYSARGAGDPGNLIMTELVLAGAEGFDYAKGEDIAAWKRRQAKLNLMGERLAVDGVAGPGTMAAMRRRGFADGRAIDAAVEAQ